MKADLHVHTNHTDGSDNPEEVFKKAKEMNVTTIAITDHDTLYGMDIHYKLAEKYSIEYIPGIEISAYDYKNNKKCHIVGLYVKEGYKPLDEMIEKITKARHENSFKQIEKLIELGYNIKFDDFKNKTGIHGIYKQHIMDVLIRKGYAKEIYGEFYEKMFKNNGPLQMTIPYPSHTEAVKILSEPGGIPILAHPTLYDNLDSLEELVDNGLKGIEVSYPYVTTENAKIIRKLALKYNLFLSGGSDYHGSYAASSNGSIGSHFVTKLKIS